MMRKAVRLAIERKTGSTWVTAVWAGCWLGPVVVASGQFVVDGGGTGTHTTIQAAIDDASDGFEIVVLPGVYHERINFGGKAIRIRSINSADAEVVAGTVIDGSGAGSVVRFESGEGWGSVLAGFTIRNGDSDTDGGGIWCVNGSSPRILRNRIHANVCGSNGGGLYCASGSSPWVLENVILGNRCGGRGGGIYCESAAPRIERNVIDGNLAGCSAGGGIYLAAGATDTVVFQNTIVRNISRLGGGIAIADANPRIERNRIIGNYGIPRGGGISCSNADATFVSNVVSGNRAEIAAAADCVQSDVVFLLNTFVGNWATDAAVLLFIGGSAGELTGNVIAFSRAGAAVQALAGGTVTADYNCLFGNPSGDFVGSVTQGSHNLFVDPEMRAVGAWVFSGLDEDDEGPPCDAGGRVELVAHFSGPGPVGGYAQYRLRPDRERFDLEVSNFPPGSHNVLINDTVVGQVFVDGSGFGTLEFDTNDGNFPPSFPDVLMGDEVRVAEITSAALGPGWAGVGDIWRPGDAHLQDASPIRDGGPPSVPDPDAGDMDGQPRLAGTASDIGADEIVPPGTGDWDGDGDVDFVDTGHFQLCFRGPGMVLPDPACAAEDLDGDGDVDLEDWIRFLTSVTGPF